MIVLLFSPILALSLSAGNARAMAPDSARTATKTATIESRLEYRFFPQANQNRRYTLALEQTRNETATIRLLRKSGEELYQAEVNKPSLVRHFDLRYLDRGTYTLQIRFGSQVREESIRID